MTLQLADNFRFRRKFGQIGEIVQIPHLLEIQRLSYEKFLQGEPGPEERMESGLHGVFRSVFPIKDFNETASLEFVSYTLGEPNYTVEECHQRGMTYAAPLKVTIQLVLWDVDPRTEARTIKNVKEQEVYFGEIPLMASYGTFMVNGTERVIVSQLHRSPGVFFDHDKGKTHASGKFLYSARIIPSRGSWIDFEFDPKDILYVRIDRRRKFHATVLLRALGMTVEDLLTYFYPTDTITVDGGRATKKFQPQLLLGLRATHDVRHPKTQEVLVKEGRRFTRNAIRQMEAAEVEQIPIGLGEIAGSVTAHDVLDPETQEVLLECNQELSQEDLDRLIERKVSTIETFFIDESPIGPSLRKTLLQDKIASPEEAKIEIYRRLRPGDPPTAEAARVFFENLFFNAERYDLSKVGRLKLNHKLQRDTPLDLGTLRKEDILEVARYLFELKNGNGVVDDIDHLGNRRVRAVGELVENQFRIGLVRMERAVKERMSLQDVETLMPQELVNYKPVSAALKEFFGSSQLSQFMDQTNPLSEVAHKRRLSALGPGGLTRERAGFEVRDVHPTHYGRVCPIETPEGPNIGLIASLSTYARVNEFGFIETPYRKVEDGRVTQDVQYLSALEEETQTIAQANAPIDEDGRFIRDLVSSRQDGEFVMVQPDQVQLMDVSPTQLVSVAAALIPFLEHDDANRALMGSNMQRQAVPLLRTEAPLVGTGMEQVVARDSGVTVVARRSGFVENVDSRRVVIRADTPLTAGDATVDIYPLIKYQRSNQNTCVNQRPIVKVGDSIKAGDVIADGPATDMGELALGRNVLVAFMIWEGYNFEDSILVSERMLREDVFTSVHIEEFECVARDTKLGPEEITQDIPNVGEEALKDLDSSGIVRIGAEVRPGDILVGKITPKGETQLSPEEKLLRAIFGEKAGEVRDTSLRIPPGVEGTVINARVFSRKGVEKDERSQSIEDEEVERLRRDREDKIRIIEDSARGRLKQLLAGRQTTRTTRRVVDLPTRFDILLAGNLRWIIECKHHAESDLGEKEITQVKRYRKQHPGAGAAILVSSATACYCPPSFLEDAEKAKIPVIIIDTTYARSVPVFKKEFGPDLPNKDDRELSWQEAFEADKPSVLRLTTDRWMKPTEFEELCKKRLKEALGEAVEFPSHSQNPKVLLAKGEELTKDILGELPTYVWDQLRSGDDAIDDELSRSVPAMLNQLYRIPEECKEEVKKLRGGDELAPGVTKMVKVFVAMKRKLQVGDKMAGRHGNKGVLSRILPEEDMPHLADGTPVDVVLNPLGVPSRMNLGQILETHLGWAVRGLGEQMGNGQPTQVKDRRARLQDVYDNKDLVDTIQALPASDLDRLIERTRTGVHVATPVFDGAPEKEIFDLLQKAGLPESGQTVLYDGRTGEPFDGAITVGVMYILKLHHLVEDKIHARSTGPYSLVTQQPLGGKAQFGGQRLGEMEVWALEAYGAAYSLQEVLTVKSDDVAGRTRIYEAIVKGDNVLEPGLPESFNVMVRELQSLALNVELLEDDE